MHECVTLPAAKIMSWKMRLIDRAIEIEKKPKDRENVVKMMLMLADEIGEVVLPRPPLNDLSDEE